MNQKVGKCCEREKDPFVHTCDLLVLQNGLSLKVVHKLGVYEKGKPFS